MRTRALLVFIAISLFLPAAAFAKGPRDGRGPGPHLGPPSPEMLVERATEAGIDEATIEQLLAIMEANKDVMETLQKELMAAHDELRALVEADAPDRDAILQQVEAVGAMETDLRKQHLSIELEVRSLLTPEQWAQLRPPMGPMRGEGPDGPPPCEGPR
ncbi:MAG: hypothetical protein AUK47_28350 [Deltaproteobacteria bacterium CG2_30_63_29]|nr:MAG: hypothetical protein AUK47_28350 [Deltaproteobacteria bacterium CG2_30_63_29]PIW02705.1 MAG: hypothetical protein COW42_00205 [Deltaproteobacteria bacterium CG17_big_fil_post_rev_8_21_14_2_50_63_7]PJB39881.1 MAG: hypothetical protein CO108_16190 [Deltaproteobacteria bacterium CG_4_9_14_3_um_filter_63_12]